MSTEMIVNLDHPHEQRNLLNTIRAMRGTIRVSFCQHRPRRSDRQNKFYWPCFVQPFAEFLREQGEILTDEEAHELLKAKFLRRTVVDRRTGQPVGVAIRSTTDLNTAEFNEYLDRCAYWLADMFGIVVPEPDTYRERDAARTEKMERCARNPAGRVGV
jgi:hypothetical protein